MQSVATPVSSLAISLVAPAFVMHLQRWVCGQAAASSPSHASRAVGRPSTWPKAARWRRPGGHGLANPVNNWQIRWEPGQERERVS